MGWRLVGVPLGYGVEVGRVPLGYGVEVGRGTFRVWGGGW